MNQDYQKPAWLNDWKTFLLFSVFSFAFAFGLRCLDLPKWGDPAFSVNGEYIMGTHDAYFWLAGAKGVGNAVGNPMAGIVRLLGDMTGAQYGNVAFWLPAVMSGLTAIAALAWGMLVAGPWVGLCAGVYATSIPMFYFRTRLTYYDTDLVTVLFPLLVSVLLARWISFGIRDSWLPEEKGSSIDFTPSVWEYLLPVVAGVSVSYGRLWHADIVPFGIFSLFAAAGLAILCGTAKTRSVLIKGLLLYAIAAFFGLPGGLVALLIVGLHGVPAIREKLSFNNVYVYLLLIGILLVVSDAGIQLLYVSQKIISYMKPVAGNIDVSASGPKYPGIAQSVIEAQNIKFSALIHDLTGSTYLSGFGLLGFLFLLYRKPCAIFLLPLAAMTIAAVKLGGRFSMFGGVVLGLGGSFVLYFLVQMFIKENRGLGAWHAMAGIFFITLLMGGTFNDYRLAPVTPIMHREHAKALTAMSSVAPQDSTFWTWWDWGYATMYYTGKKSFADGGRHAGPLLFPLAFAYTTPSYLQANQFIKYSAAANGNPAVKWDKMKIGEIEKLVYSMGVKDLGYSNKPKQYIVASWSDVRLAYWILYYGSCNLRTGQGIHPNVSTVGAAFSLDREKGQLLYSDGSMVPLSGYDIAEPGKRERKLFENSVGPYLLFNTAVSQGFLVDDFVRQSLLINLLLCDPARSDVSSNFRLVYEGFPMVRVYEVL